MEKSSTHEIATPYTEGDDRKRSERAAKGQQPLQEQYFDIPETKRKRMDAKPLPATGRRHEFWGTEHDHHQCRQ